MAKKNVQNEGAPVMRKRKLYFRALKKIMKMKYKQPRFIYLGEEFEPGSLVLSNHEGTDAPMSLEIYLNKPIRMWGASEMNSGLIAMYKYQSRVYYHEKKHWNLFLARLFCLIASPLTNLFYSGLDLISTYRDVNMVKTVRESIEVLKSGESIVVFPEDSTNGYLAELEGFHAGFAFLADVCRRRGMDLPIVVSYYRKSDNTYIFDKPVRYSELLSHTGSREEVARLLCERCNELGRMHFDENGKPLESERPAAVSEANPTEQPKKAKKHA
ncbi:MAG: hypothetical protein IJD51_05415 [Clostridia bacterium]|nr:hypothetical protein [Clostridia bacterium]